MKYTRLGRTGLEVSRLALGCMSYGDPGWRPWVQGEAVAREHIKAALDWGINFFDTADMYSHGLSEEITGKLLGEMASRPEVVIATKVFFPVEKGKNRSGLSRKHVLAACDDSLRRLGTDFIDLYQIHRWDEDTPVEEAMDALGALVRAGKVRYLGLSEAAPPTIRRAHAVHPISALQTEYSLWTRDPEDEVLPTVRALGIGFVAYSPLGRGFLSGRFKSIEDLDPGDWRRRSPRFQGANFQKNLDLVARIGEIAGDKRVTPSQLALAWVLHRGDDIVPIPGTKRVPYLEENIRALDIALDAEDLRRIDEAAPAGAAAGDRYQDMSTVNR